MVIELHNIWVCKLLVYLQRIEIKYVHVTTGMCTIFYSGTKYRNQKYILCMLLLVYAIRIYTIQAFFKELAPINVTIKVPINLTAILILHRYIFRNVYVLILHLFLLFHLV